MNLCTFVENNRMNETTYSYVCVYIFSRYPYVGSTGSGGSSCSSNRRPGARRAGGGCVRIENMGDDKGK